MSISVELAFSSLQARMVYALRFFSLQAMDRLYSVFEKPLDLDLSPIFIVGCGHSGTTLMAALLNAHPDTNVIKSETFVFRFANKPSEIHRKLSKVADGGLRIVEKTPKHIRYIRRVFRLYPNARILVMLRDGRDVACSIRARTGHLMRGAERWVFDNGCVRGLLDDRRIKIVKLEKLLGHPREELNSICDFLGLERKADLVERHADGHFDYYEIQEGDIQRRVSSHALGRAKQANEPIGPRAPRWPMELGDAEACRLASVIGDALIETGYESNLDWVNRLG